MRPSSRRPDQVLPKILFAGNVDRKSGFTLADKFGFTSDNFHTGFLQPLLQCGAEPPDRSLFTMSENMRIKAQIIRTYAEHRRVIFYSVMQPGRIQQSLGRDTAVIQANASELLLLE